MYCRSGADAYCRCCCGSGFGCQSGPFLAGGTCSSLPPPPTLPPPPSPPAPPPPLSCPDIVAGQQTEIDQLQAEIDQLEAALKCAVFEDKKTCKIKNCDEDPGTLAKCQKQCKKNKLKKKCKKTCCDAGF